MGGTFSAVPSDSSRRFRLVPPWYGFVCGYAIEKPNVYAVCIACNTCAPVVPLLVPPRVFNASYDRPHLALDVRRPTPGQRFGLVACCCSQTKSTLLGQWMNFWKVFSSGGVVCGSFHL